MWFEQRSARPERSGSTVLELRELIAARPLHLRGPLAPGQRVPGGERSGRGRAQGFDLDGVGPYVPGDDVRWIDWRATARSGTPKSKRFLAHSHRARMIVPDLAADLRFGTRDRLMLKTVALAAAYLAWESLILAEPVGLALPGESPVAPRRGRRHLLGLLDMLRAAHDQSTGRDRLAAAVTEGSGMVGRQDEVCVISDFAGVPGLVAESRALAGIRTLRAFLVEDPLSHRPLPRGVYPARNPADGERRAFRIGARAAAMSEEVAAACRAGTVRQLRDGGWEVRSALDLLPRGSHGPEGSR